MADVKAERLLAELDRLRKDVPEDKKGITEWSAMTKEFYETRPAGWLADEEAFKARRAAFMRASEEKLALLGDPDFQGVVLEGQLGQFPLAWAGGPRP